MVNLAKLHEFLFPSLPPSLSLSLALSLSLPLSRSLSLSLPLSLPRTSSQTCTLHGAATLEFEFRHRISHKLLDCSMHLLALCPSPSASVRGSTYTLLKLGKRAVAGDPYEGSHNPKEQNNKTVHKRLKVYQSVTGSSLHSFYCPCRRLRVLKPSIMSLPFCKTLHLMSNCLCSCLRFSCRGGS